MTQKPYSPRAALWDAYISDNRRNGPHFICLTRMSTITETIPVVTASTTKKDDSQTILIFLEDLFSEDNPCDSVLRFSDDNSVAYTVATRHPSGSAAQTIIRDGSGKQVAEVDWAHDAHADILTLENEKPIKAHDWLRKSSIPFHT